MDTQNNMRQKNGNTVDLGPLSWVINSLRDSLDEVQKNLANFRNEVSSVNSNSLTALETTSLRTATKNLHDVTGVLELIERPAAARIAAAMGHSIQRFVSNPELCSQQAVESLNQGINALLDYLDSLLKGHPDLSVGLFSVYREIAQLAGLDRIHPADLWHYSWEWLEIDNDAQPSSNDQATQSSSFFENLLAFFKNGNVQNAAALINPAQLAWQQSTEQEHRIFWQLATGFLQLLASGALALDKYSKISLSRIAVQYNLSNQDPETIPEQLVRDLLFFNALGYSKQSDSTLAPIAHSIWQRYALQQACIFDYNQRLYGKVDAALLQKIRTQIVSFKELWSDMASGDTRKGTTLLDEATHLAHSINTIWPNTQSFTEAILATVRNALQSAHPQNNVAMEMATTILFLEASLDDMQASSANFSKQAEVLTQRLQAVQRGEQLEPLADWMEASYGQTTNKDNLDQVISESLLAFNEAEQALDDFFRHPEKTEQAQGAIEKLKKISIIMELLEFQEAARAILAMIDDVQQLLAVADRSSIVDDPNNQNIILRLGNNLSTFSFMLDMMRYQPDRAKQQFRFDDKQQGLLDNKILMPSMPEPEPASEPTRQAPILESAPEVPVTKVHQEKPITAVTDTASTEDEDSLDEIFLEEASEVINNAYAAINSLHSNMADIVQLTNLRRAFHTLKGSSRMVGLSSFGEAAWEIERTLNSWLADGKPASQALLQLTSSALFALEEWRKDILEKKDSSWSHLPFKAPALAMQEHGTFIPITIDNAVPESSSENLLSHTTSSLAAHSDGDIGISQEVHAEASELLSGNLLEGLSFAEDKPASVNTSTNSHTPESDTAASSAHAQTSGEESFTENLPANDLQQILSVFPGSEISLPAGSAFSDNFLTEDVGANSTENLPQSSENNFELSLETPLTRTSESLQHSISTDEEILFTDDLTVPVSESEKQFFGETNPLTESTTTTTPTDAIDDSLHNKVFQEDTFPPNFPTSDNQTDSAVKHSDSEEIINNFSASLLPAELSSPSIAAMLHKPGHQLAVLKDMTDGLPEDEIKHIGNLQVPLALFNAYLNEADTWSRQLVQELSEWVLDVNQYTTESLSRLAHTLAGSSDTVGLPELACIARGIEHALAHFESQPATHEEVQTLLKAAEKMRQDLHQFAAGITRPIDIKILTELANIIDSKLPKNLDTSNSSVESLTELEEKKNAVTSDVQAEHIEQPLVTTETPPDIDKQSQSEIEHALSGTEEIDDASNLFLDDQPKDDTNNPQAETSSSTNIHSEQETLDPDLFPVFVEEAVELLQQLNATMRQWVDQPDNQSASQELMRLLHTFKGGARLAGAMHLGDMAHDLESAISIMPKNACLPENIETLQAMLDDMDNHFKHLLSVQQNAQQHPSIEAPLPLSTPALTPVAQEVSIAKAQTVAMPVTTHIPPQQVTTQQVRVRSHVLDNMLGQTGEVMSSRARLESEVVHLRQAMHDMDQNLGRLRSHLREMELQAESQIQSRSVQSSSHANDFDPLEFDRFTRVQELTRMMAESVNDVAGVQGAMLRAVHASEDNLSAQSRHTKELQNDLLRTRMIEFDTLAERLYYVVRQTAKETSKQVKLEIVGAHIEMDRSIIERIAPVLEHLLRNAVVHGIETSEERANAGKNAIGQITIHLYHEGNDVAITLRDDGAGLNIAKIREKAIAQGLLDAQAHISDEEIAQFIFHSGLSTADEITTAAGRGVGMDAVLAEINAIGGRIEIDSQPRIGTEFILVLPLTTAITQVVEIRAGKKHFGIPSLLIESVQRTTSENIRQAYETQTYNIDNDSLPFYWAGAILQTSPISEEISNKRQIVVVLRSATQRIVMHVSAIVNNYEVVVKNLGHQLARLPGLSGATILPNGQLLCIYNPVALSVVYAEQIRTFSTQQHPINVAEKNSENKSTASNTKPLVLVVDDSITVRRVTERMLKREGYRVALAADGVEALHMLEALDAEKPAVVLSDIEMPQMDGFELLRNIRHNPSLKDLPIIMITSRSADKHRQYAMEHGASDFLGKPYSEDHLLQTIEKYSQTNMSMM